MLHGVQLEYVGVLLAQEVDMNTVTIGDVMSFDLVTVDAETKLLDAIDLMRTKGVRRVPVVDSDSSLVGILSVDDIIDLLAEQITNIAKLISTEQKKEQARCA